jgi:hypothetical protein
MTEEGSCEGLLGNILKPLISGQSFISQSIYYAGLEDSDPKGQFFSCNSKFSAAVQNVAGNHESKFKKGNYIYEHFPKSEQGLKSLVDINFVSFKGTQSNEFKV